MTREIVLSTQEQLLAEGILSKSRSLLKQMEANTLQPVSVSELCSLAAAKALALLHDHEDVSNIVMENISFGIANSNYYLLRTKQQESQIKELQEEVARLSKLLEESGQITVVDAVTPEEAELGEVSKQDS